MSNKSNLVNLDAMISREDFASNSDTQPIAFESVSTIGVRDFTSGALIGPSLRKPDFQRETNHWSPEQVVSLLECFINGDLIPSVILWKSPTYLFVIDGGHRISALKAWVEDDYGDGPKSQAYFGYNISSSQKKAAERTRSLVQEKIGTWQHLSASITANLIPEGLITLISRGMPIQWVSGNADKAESSFFRINTQGAALDDVEELLLRNRKKPVSIAARAVIRAGQGHKYWSNFQQDKAVKIEQLAKQLHEILFDPELKTPVKTLDLPLGGPKGVRIALQVLIEVILISMRTLQGYPASIDETAEDVDGTETINVLVKTLELAQWITGNDKGSLGLHPAVYFYGPTGRHSSPMFMGTLSLIKRKLLNNDKNFFKKFTEVRSRLETILIDQKDLIATVMQRLVSRKRVEIYAHILDSLIKSLANGEQVTTEQIVTLAGLGGKIITGSAEIASKEFSDDAKGEVFIRTSLAACVKCSLCGGYLDTTKSLSYDHITRVREGGKGSAGNGNLTHPYCNQALKN